MSKLYLDYIPITSEMAERARKDANSLDTQHGRDTRLTRDSGFIGSLAQQAVAKQFSLWGLKPENSRIFDPSITSDECDFVWRYERCDVKGSPCGKNWHDVFPNTHFFIETEKKKVHEEKGLQRYVFVKIDLEENMAIISGVMSFEDFWKKGVDARVAGMRVKIPTTFVDARQLDSFRKFVYSA